MKLRISAKRLLLSGGLLASATAGLAADHPAVQKKAITIRTEEYPRLPYSEAKYYIYERNGQVICTKLAVCDKYDACDTEYHAGTYKADQDAKTGKPYGSSAAVLIPPQKLSKHVCLSKYGKDIR
ncbi:hypothetical protein [Frateuria defendens]|uniref:hypothetical protein n=1 Tax=Frateuria defendens TaxID=2219559 RepID=UPI001929BA2B|nr:hypothetical protein [Frateuria defendens]